MNVVINKDQETATDSFGQVYKINGLVIKKKEGIPDAFYPAQSSMCKAVVFPGLVLEAIDLGNSKINLL